MATAVEIEKDYIYEPFPWITTGFLSWIFMSFLMYIVSIPLSRYLTLTI